MKRASETPWSPPTCTNCGGGLTRSACGALCRTCIDGGVTFRPQEHIEPTDHLDGPKLTAWLYSHGLFNLQLQLGERLAARVAAWQKRPRTTVPVWDADEVLTSLDLHLSELPDEFWVEITPLTVRRRYCQEIKPEVVDRLLRGGQSATELAEEFGIDPWTIWNWARAERDEPIAA